MARLKVTSNDPCDRSYGGLYADVVPLAFALGLWGLGGCNDANDTEALPIPPITRDLGLNDVSILLPLPDQADGTALLKLDDVGVDGPLLPRSWFDAIDVFADEARADQAYDQWRIVGMRIDPCFPDISLLTSAPQACRRQLRLIAQPLAQPNDAPGGGPTLVAADHAIHLLFDLDSETFRAFVAGWRAALASAGAYANLPLQVHPLIARQGLHGELATSLRALVLAAVGQDALSQLTFMEGNGVEWQFGGLRVVDGELVPLEIAGLFEADAPTQVYRNPDNQGFSFAQRSPTTDLLMPLAGAPNEHGNGIVLTASEEEIDAALQLSLDIDNPTSAFHADSVDCASCHIAGRARRRADMLGFPSDDLAGFSHPSFDLTQSTPPDLATSARVLRAFGYVQATPVVNQRVIHESAVVADVLNAQ